MKTKNPEVIVVMGSQSDLPVMAKATDLLEEFGVNVKTQIVSAHRTPELLQTSVVKWESQGVRVIIAGAGGAAHLPGMLASFSVLPVIGVPVKSKALGGLDSLLSIAQMPAGVPVACVAVDNSVNAGLLALQILSAADPARKKLRHQLAKYKNDLNKKVKASSKQLETIGVKKFVKTLS